MLDALRKGAGTWVAKIFIALLVMSFAVWGIADIFRGFGQNVAATVGNTEISLFSFDRTYRRDLAQLSQRIGRNLSTTEGAQFGIPQQTLGKLVAQAALNETASGLNLGISDEKLAQAIQKDPTFQGPAGGYDRARLQQILRNLGMTEDEFVVEQRQLAERQQLAEALTGTMQAPSAFLQVLHAYQSETRNLKYLVVPAENTADIADPNEETLKTFFEEKKADFRAPEYRKVMLLELTPTALARPDDVSDEDARADYERDKNRYHEPERRKVRQISYSKPEDAAAAAEELAAGKTFDDLMAEQNLTDNDVFLGLMAKSDFLDPAIGDAAFKLQQDETSGVVDGKFSSVILNVIEVQPEQIKPFEEVKGEIKAQIAKDRAARDVLDLLNEIEDARAGGALLSEVADRFSLNAQTPDAFDAQGQDEAGKDVSLPKADGLVKGTFDSDIGVENDPIQLKDGGFLWYEVTNVTPARDRELSEVRQKVIDAWKAEEVTKRLQAKATEIADKAKSGAEIAALAEETGLEEKIVTGIARNSANGDFTANAANLAFSGPDGTVFDTEGADGSSRLVAKVEGSNEQDFDPNAQEIKSLETSAANQMQDSLLNQYVANAEDTAGVQINQAAISQILGLNKN